ncbi:hypothetical protein [Fructobacillus americanaquae]|uniref:DNA-directed RNA polymerase beta subunit n=1 Tax=Fructobacillus americanaquae TaxID=2940302 RepID=A0ABY5C4A1_9LACO|nr:hypothetical protein [Fructobacillus americanaquae]USS92131.1 hypothetical protein M3M36_00490 [Fructobacillus americanaquae]
MSENFFADPDWLSTVSGYFDHDYRDRGKVKWNGFFLSDHTAELKNQKTNQDQADQTELHEAMSYEQMQQVVALAYRNSQRLVVQANSFDIEGRASPVEIGKVTGFFMDGFYLDKEPKNWEDLQFVGVDHDRK